jgi:hypothetical protein
MRPLAGHLRERAEQVQTLGVLEHVAGDGDAGGVPVKDALEEEEGLGGSGVATDEGGGAGEEGFGEHAEPSELPVEGAPLAGDHVLDEFARLRPGRGRADSARASSISQTASALSSSAGRRSRYSTASPFGGKFQPRGVEACRRGARVGPSRAVPRRRACGRRRWGRCRARGRR